MNITIVGPFGKCGRELVDVFKNHNVNTITRIDCDLTEPDRVGRLIRFRKPDVVINAAAYNGMEPCDKDPMMALEINAIAPAIMAAACKDIGARFVHFSTDYVFSGDPTKKGLVETMPIKPSGKYGWSKAKAEEIIPIVGDRWLIFRLSSIYGRQYGGPTDPINQVLQGKGTKENPVKVLHQQCAPTSARSIAVAVKHVVEKKPEPTGLYHMATDKAVWKKEFAEYIIKKIFDREYVVAEGTLPVPRPIHTVLKCDLFEKTFSYGLGNWINDFSYMKVFMPKVEMQTAAN